VESKVHTESNVFSPTDLLHLPDFHTDHDSNILGPPWTELSNFTRDRAVT